MAPYAFVTLLTSDSYLPGALVTAHSLKETEKSSPQNFDLVCLITVDKLRVESVKALRRVFDVVINVDEIRSSHCSEELNLLGRQDLESSVTKIHVWRLIQYQKIIYLDADTLPLKPLSHLFLTESQFSACPDIGWPDCFNSGMMVLQPSNLTFEKIYEKFISHGSWDGGDQGLLNDFFSQVSDSTVPSSSESSENPIWNRLSFIYNVTPSAYYTYAPAYKRHQDRISMVHFIGREKPWHLVRRFRNSRRSAQNSSALDAVNYEGLVEKWFNVYERAYGPIETILASEENSGHFSFPRYASQWDNSQTSTYQPPTLEELKKLFTKQTGDSFLQFNQLQSTDGVAAYITMLLPDKLRILLEQRKSFRGVFAEERPEKSMSHDSLYNNVSDLPQKPSTNDRDPPDETRSHQHTLDPPSGPIDDTTHSYVPCPSEAVTSIDPNPITVVDAPIDHGGGHQESRPNFDSQVWDASRSDPPSQGFQMNQPFIHHYEPAWDKPTGDESQRFFQPPPTNQPIGFIPPITHQDYSQFTSHSPQPEAVKPIFPWENNSRTQAGRVFPTEESPSGWSERKEHASSSNNPNDRGSNSSDQGTPPQAIQHASLSQIYTNAWDEDPMIRRWNPTLNIGSEASRDARTTPNAGWRQFGHPSADLSRTPALELKKFISDGSYLDEGAQSGAYGKDPSLDRPPSLSVHENSALMSTYRTRRDSENSSRDADEEDEGEEDELTSDGGVFEEAEEDVGTIGGKLGNTQIFNENEEQSRTGIEKVGDESSRLVPRKLPTTRSIIIGVPVQVNKLSEQEN